MVLLHPGLWDSRTWDDQWDAFAARHRVLRYDLRGYGRSDRPSGQPYSHVRDLFAVMDAVGMPSAALVGCSMGGVALDAALTDPSRVTALVLAAASLGGNEGTDEDQQEWEDRFGAIEGLVRAGELNGRRSTSSDRGRRSDSVTRPVAGSTTSPSTTSTTSRWTRAPPRSCNSRPRSSAWSKSPVRPSCCQPITTPVPQRESQINPGGSDPRRPNSRHSRCRPRDQHAGTRVVQRRRAVVPIQGLRTNRDRPDGSCAQAHRRAVQRRAIQQYGHPWTRPDRLALLISLLRDPSRRLPPMSGRC